MKLRKILHFNSWEKFVSLFGRHFQIKLHWVHLKTNQNQTNPIHQKPKIIKFRKPSTVFLMNESNNPRKASWCFTAVTHFSSWINFEESYLSIPPSFLSFPFQKAEGYANSISRGQLGHKVRKKRSREQLLRCPSACVGGSHWCSFFMLMVYSILNWVRSFWKKRSRSFQERCFICWSCSWKTVDLTSYFHRVTLREYY